MRLMYVLYVCICIVCMYCVYVLCGVCIVCIVCTANVRKYNVKIYKLSLQVKLLFTNIYIDVVL